MNERGVALGNLLCINRFFIRLTLLIWSVGEWGNTSSYALRFYNKAAQMASAYNLSMKIS
jgi:hypothetical protein